MTTQNHPASLVHIGRQAQKTFCNIMWHLFERWQTQGANNSQLCRMVLAFVPLLLLHRHNHTTDPARLVAEAGILDSFYMTIASVRLRLYSTRSWQLI